MRDYRAIARQTLSSYLATANVGDPTVRVSAQWPQAARDVGTTEITVVMPGSGPVTIVPHQPKLWAYVDGVAIYSYALVELDLQLDVWAPYQETRDLIAGTLEGQLNRPSTVTVAGSAMPQYRRNRGLSLRATELHDSVITYRMTPVPPVTENNQAVHQDDWRATWLGTATLHALDSQAVVALTDLQINLSLNGPPTLPIP